MNISPIKIFSTKSFTSRAKNYNLAPLKQDTVSFSGKKVNIENETQNVQDGYKIAKKLMKLQRSNQLNYENIEATLQASAPIPIEIKNISEFPQQLTTVSPFVAQMLPFYDEKTLQVVNADIYIKTCQNAKEAGDLIANTAHEYTHMLQRVQNKDYYGIANKTKDKNEIINIGRLSQQIYKGYENSIIRRLGENPSFVKQIRGKGFSEKEIEKLLENVPTLNEYCDNFIENNMAKTQEGSYIIRNSKLEKEEIVSLIKNWIKTETGYEKEAYDVTLKSLEAWGKYDTVTKNSREVMRHLNSIWEKSL